MMQFYMKRIQAQLSPDLLRRDWGPHPHAGHCYVASEALWHLTDCCMLPYRARDDNGIVHWWLQAFRTPLPFAIYDCTAGQYTDFGLTPPYEKGKCGGFLTKQPSKRAQILIKKVLDSM